MTETPSKSRESLQKNVAEPEENCPSMREINGSGPRFHGQISVENGVSAEKAPENGFQMPEDALFSSQTVVSKQPEGPCYRRIHVYSKSLVRYKKERERRRQIRLLVEKGFKQKQIAEKLGVSVRTVKRDWRKIGRYVTGDWNRSRRQITEARRKELFPNLEGFGNLEGTAVHEGIAESRARMRALFQQIRLIGPALKEEVKYERRVQELLRKYNRQIIFTMNLDNLDQKGIPSIEIFPRRMLIYCREKEFWINFRVLKNGVKHELGRMRLSPVC